MILSEQLTGFHQPDSRWFTLKRINQVLLVGLVIVAVFFWARPTLASDDDTIDTVSSDGDHIIMQSGEVYQSDDPGTSSTWQPGGRRGDHLR